MNFNVTEATARGMADRLRKAFGKDVVRESKSLEVVSSMLGAANWDTLIGMLRKEAKVSAPTAPAVSAKLPWYLPEFEPVTLYLDTCCSNHEADRPEWAKVLITPEWLRTAHGLASTCIEKGFKNITICGDTEWHNDVKFWMSGGTLTVSANGFWYEAYPKHADYYVETSLSIDFDLLSTVISQGRHQFDEAVIRRGNTIVFAAGGALGLIDSLIEAGELDEEFMLHNVPV